MKQYADGKGVAEIQGDLLFTKIVVDANSPGTRNEIISRGLYQFTTILNNTQFDFNIYRGNTNDRLEILGNCPAFTIITFPFDINTGNVFIEWLGTTTTNIQRCIIYLTNENLGLVSQFKAPQVQPVATPTAAQDRLVFGGNVVIGNIVTAQSRIVIRTMYISNNTTNPATITLAHNRNAVNIPILPGISIPANSVVSTALIALEMNDILTVVNVTGSLTILIYGEGV